MKTQAELVIAVFPLRAQSPGEPRYRNEATEGAGSRTLCGLMTEEISYAYDGGLYADAIRNRTFIHWTCTLNWLVLEKGSAAAKISIDSKEDRSPGLSHPERIVPYNRPPASTATMQRGMPAYSIQVVFGRSEKCFGSFRPCARS